MATETYRDPALEWLDHVQPVGLVVAPAVLKDLILEPTPQSQIDSATLLGPKGEVFIVHQQQVYRLRVTAQGKLILTK